MSSTTNNTKRFISENWLRMVIAFLALLIGILGGTYTQGVSQGAVRQQLTEVEGKIDSLRFETRAEFRDVKIAMQEHSNQPYHAKAGELHAATIERMETVVKLLDEHRTNTERHETGERKLKRILDAQTPLEQQHAALERRLSAVEREVARMRQEVP